MKLTLKDRKIIAGLVVWTFINLYVLLFTSYTYSQTSHLEGWEPFFSISETIRCMNLRFNYTFDDCFIGFNHYDLSEFFVYVGLPILIFGLFKFLKAGTENNNQ